MELKCGDVHIALRPDVAPNHAERLKELTREGFYDGIIFHRVIDGFMAQTGDPTGTGMGGSDRPDVAAEFSDVPFNRGTVGMARSSDPDSANSQFFIMFAEGSFLNGNYTVVGEVVEGMDCVDQINKGEPPASPDQIINMQVMTDAG
jgi:peptidylprolyl isomerase